MTLSNQLSKSEYNSEHSPVGIVIIIFKQ